MRVDTWHAGVDVGVGDQQVDGLAQRAVGHCAVQCDLDAWAVFIERAIEPAHVLGVIGDGNRDRRTRGQAERAEVKDRSPAKEETAIVPTVPEKVVSPVFWTWK